MSGYVVVGEVAAARALARKQERAVSEPLCPLSMRGVHHAAC